MVAARTLEADPKIERVVNAVESIDLRKQTAWTKLGALSSDTYVDGIEVDPAGVILRDGTNFNGVANIYVLLRYGDLGDGEAFETTESFLGKFRGHFAANGKPVVEEVTVDTSPFFAGEEAADG